MKEPKVKGNLTEQLKAVVSLLSAKQKYDENPCTTKKGDKPCADQGIDFDSMCQNCKNAWADVAVIGDQTPQEALDFIREIKKEKETDKYLEGLALAPCENETIYGHCSEQGISVPNMCDNCKKFWVEASASAGQTPDQALELSKEFFNFVFGKDQNDKQAN